MGPIAAGITKLANLVHRQVLSDERHVANLESLKDEFGIGTTAATTPGLLKAFLNVLYVRAVDVVPEQIGVVLPMDSGKWPVPDLITSCLSWMPPDVNYSRMIVPERTRERG